jgi:Polyketide cyclase / dehydrase and lipid transport
VIAAPPAAVFPWLADSERRCSWMGALVESEPLTDGPPREGSRYRDVFEQHGQRIELEAELVEVDEPDALVVHLVSDLFEGTISQRLEAVEGGTHFTAVIETTYRKLAARLLASIVTRQTQGQLEQDLARLKQLVESEPAAASA